MTSTNKIMTAVIIALSVLLLITTSALAFVLVYGNDFRHDSDMVTDNVISPKEQSLSSEKALSLKTASSVGYTRYPMLAAWFFVPAAEPDETLELYKNHPDDNTPFDVRNMFPGDSVSKTYCVKISYRGTLTVHFNAAVRQGYEKLAEVLECSVYLRSENETEGTLLYSGLMKDMPESVDTTVSNGGRTTEKLYYDITVSLDTSVGNEYQRKMLIADFEWWADCEPGRPIGPIVPVYTDTTAPDVTTKPDVTTEPKDTDKPDVTTTKEKDPDVTTIPDDTTSKEPDVTIIPEVTTTKEKEPDITTVPEVTTPHETTDEGPVTGTPDGELVSPSTGSTIVVLGIMLLAFGMAVLVILVRRKKEDAKHE